MNILMNMELQGGLEVMGSMSSLDHFVCVTWARQANSGLDPVQPCAVFSCCDSEMLSPTGGAGVE